MIAPRMPLLARRRSLVGALALAVAVPLVVSGCAAPNPTSAPSVTAGPVVVDLISRDDPALPVHLHWPTYQNLPSLNERLRAWMTDADRAFVADNAPSVEVPPELNGTGSEVVRSGSVIGVRLDVLEFAGADAVRSTATFYGDAKSAASWSADQLVASDRAEALRDAILDAAVAEKLDIFEEARTMPEARKRLLTDLTFDKTGAIIAELQESDVTVCSAGSPAVKVAADKIAPWLTAEGRATQAAFAAPASGPASPSVQAPKAEATASGTTSARPAVDCAVARCVALTFDDGPGPHTGRLLDMLDAAGVKATFFVLGTSAQAYSQEVARAAATGHVVANHTFDHKQLTRLSAAAQADEVTRGADAIVAAGAPRPTLLRPPYGSLNASTKALGVPIILWDVDTLDWKNRDSAAVTQAVAAGVHPGAIVLMHDIHPTTVDAVPGILAKLKQQGYTLVTVPDLLGQTSPGVVYFSRGK